MTKRNYIYVCMNLMDECIYILWMNELQMDISSMLLKIIVLNMNDDS